ncbi:MAG: hypothetical protein U5L04_02540 [Trueperaceae bacterium]|nr:hypothetical protein [Trueperaceae bacterium]
MQQHLRDRWADKVVSSPHLSDKDVAELLKLYQYLQPALGYQLGPRLLPAASTDGACNSQANTTYGHQQEP